MKRTWPVLVGWLLWAAPTAVQAQYTVSTNADNTINIVRDTGAFGSVIVPTNINGLTVTTIGEFAFANISNLTNVTISNGVTSIGDYAFFLSTNLTNVAIPATVTNIGSNVFNDCYGLLAITVDPANSVYGSTNGVLFGLSQDTLLEYPEGLGGNYTISNGVNSIGAYAFSLCQGLTSITIPSSVTNIGVDAFDYCTNLASAAISGSVASIGEAAFLGCASLTSVTITNGVIAIGAQAFANCTSLTGITIPTSVTNIGAEAFANCANLMAITVTPGNPVYSSTSGVLFDETALIEYPEALAGTYTIPNGVTGIGDYSFSVCQGLTGVTIPGTVTYLGQYAFNYCTNLGSVTIPGSVAGIGSNAFYYCSSLTNVTISNGVTSIGDYAFSYCSSLPEVTIPNSVTNIGQAAFFECASLTNVTMGANVASIGEEAFQGCSSLTAIYFLGDAPGADSTVFASDNNATVYYAPGTMGWSNTFAGRPATVWIQFTYTIQNNTVTITGYTGPGGAVAIPNTITNLPVVNIGNFALENTASLDSVTIPSSVTNIGENAFAGCASLTNVVLSNGVASIGQDAFEGCPIASITIPSSVTNIGDYAFDDCHSLAGVSLTNGITDIGDFAFNGCGSLVGIAIPATVTNIGNQALSQCASLTAITVNATNSFYSSANGVLFDESQSTLLQYPGGLGGSYTVPGSVTSIPDWAFAYCSLTSVTVPASVTNIGVYAFNDCSSLTAINVNATNSFYSSMNGVLFDQSQSTLLQYPGGLGGSYTVPGTVASIGAWAFSFSTLTNVTIPAGVTNIGEEAFQGCSGLTAIYFLGDAPGADSTVFSNDNNATVYYAPGTTGWSNTFGGRPATVWIQFTYTIQNNTVTITGYTGLGGAVAIPSTINSLPVVNIGNSALENTASLASVTIAGSVTNIGDNAFAGCASLTNVIISNGVASIGQDAFEGCPIASITIPSSVTNIGDYAFDDCHSLASVSLTNGVTNIGDFAFNGCGSLAGIAIPATVTNIGDQALSQCASLTAITVSATNSSYSSANGVLFDESQSTLLQYPGGLGGSYIVPGSVTSIPDWAFAYCSLTSVTVPASVTNIGVYAFNDCSSLTAINVNAANSFYSSTNGVLFDESQSTLLQYPGGLGGSYTVPGTVASIGDWAFSFSTLTNVTIPASVTNIGENAFNSCSSLALVFFQSNAPAVDASVFQNDTNAIAYYLPGSTGWGAFPGDSGVPTVLWNPQIITNDASFGLSNNQFGFNISNTANVRVVVGTTTNLGGPVWTPLTNVMLTNGLFYFSAPLQTNDSGAYYILQIP